MSRRLLVSPLTDLLFHKLHLHECAPGLIGDTFLSGNKVHRQDVPVILRTALAFLVVSEQASFSGNFGSISLVEE